MLAICINNGGTREQYRETMETVRGLETYRINIVYGDNDPLDEPCNLLIRGPADYDQYAFAFQRGIEVAGRLGHEHFVIFDGMIGQQTIDGDAIVKLLRAGAELVQTTRYVDLNGNSATALFKRGIRNQGHVLGGWAGHTDVWDRIKTYPYLPRGGFHKLMWYAATMDMTWNEERIRFLLPNKRHFEDYRAWATVAYEMLDCLVDNLDENGYPIAIEPSHISPHDFVGSDGSYIKGGSLRHKEVVCS